MNNLHSKWMYFLRVCALLCFLFSVAKIGNTLVFETACLGGRIVSGHNACVLSCGGVGTGQWSTAGVGVGRVKWESACNSKTQTERKQLLEDGPGWW